MSGGEYGMARGRKEKPAAPQVEPHSRVFFAIGGVELGGRGLAKWTRKRTVKTKNVRGKQGENKGVGPQIAS